MASSAIDRIINPATNHLKSGPPVALCGRWRQSIFPWVLGFVLFLVRALHFLLVFTHIVSSIGTWNNSHCFLEILLLSSNYRNQIYGTRFQRGVSFSLLSPICFNTGSTLSLPWYLCHSETWNWGDLKCFFLPGFDVWRDFESWAPIENLQTKFSTFAAL